MDPGRIKTRTQNVNKSCDVDKNEPSNIKSMLKLTVGDINAPKYSVSENSMEQLKAKPKFSV